LRVGSKVFFLSLNILNFYRNPVGLADLNEKNLRFQGFHVIVINPFDWNSMNMAVGNAKSEFFKNRFKKKKEILESIGVE